MSLRIFIRNTFKKYFTKVRSEKLSPCNFSWNFLYFGSSFTDNYFFNRYSLFLNLIENVEITIKSQILSTNTS